MKRAHAMTRKRRCKITKVLRVARLVLHEASSAFRFRSNFMPRGDPEMKHYIVLYG